ncbi:hypothetical protein BBBOND_0103410 [Babesia bigemina]|uniref:Uncharacterized protein n=1 Tax=Babesia bigemina TaxID=5866 RepID=A0A061CZH2_BABBI|nr:hypothetical protein BBBOND_0103410 [Babesia bigemina]CDR94026.1 hypothetical protein BBBOND_0103410 [Babesia bigemina]|eukprot:XP_012766212.1 hypothetical protein BBBOND_0103410 [Babesia bigemina]
MSRMRDSEEAISRMDTDSAIQVHDKLDAGASAHYDDVERGSSADSDHSAESSGITIYHVLSVVLIFLALLVLMLIILKRSTGVCDDELHVAVRRVEYGQALRIVEP